MFRKLIYTGLSVLTLGLTGCATNADVSPMTIGSDQLHKPKVVYFSKKIRVNDVSGGQETNPLWTSQINNENFKSALDQSLKNADLFSENNAKYDLDARLVKVEQPFIGLDLKVTCLVHYKLINEKNGKVVYNKDITSSYTATTSDSLMAITRLKMANEGAAKENINLLIKDLYQLR